MVSSYMWRPILYALLIWNYITSAFSINWTLLNIEDYKDTIFNKYKKWMVSSYMVRPILYVHLIWNHFTAAFSRYGTLFDLEGYKTPFLLSTINEWSVLMQDIPYYMHTSYETLLLQRFQDMGHYSI